MRFRLSCLGRLLYGELCWRTNRIDPVIGYSNRCIDGKYILTADYDNIPLEWIEQEIKVIQDHYEIGNILIFQSSKENYHVVCLDKMSFVVCKEILSQLTIDDTYYYVPLKYGRKTWVLRLSGKNKEEIKYIKTIKSPYDRKRYKSLAHTMLLNAWFDLAISKEQTDGETKLVSARYKV